MFDKSKKSQNKEAEKILEEPKIGEVVVANIEHIRGIKIIRETDEKLQFWHISHSEGLGNITLLKYEGNGIFTEYYTQKHVLFLPINDYGKYSSFAKEYAFSKYENRTDAELKNYFSKNPIVVSFFSKVDVNAKMQMARQESKRDELITTINHLFDTIQFEFDSLYALFLNGNQIVEDFEKGVTRKLEK